MNTRSQIIAAWCGPTFMLLTTIGWVLLAGFFPPHSPTFSGVEVADLYQTDILRIRFGLFISLWATAVFIPFIGIIGLKLAKIEGKIPVWSCAFVIAGAGTILTFGFPYMFWAVTVFRPDRAPELMLLLDDLAWIPFASMAAPFILMPICIAIVGFTDKSKNPLFPRWACYFNLWIDFLIMPGGFCFFFKTGPFAWNGLIGIWIPFIVFGIWFCVLTHLLIKDIKRDSST